MSKQLGMIQAQSATGAQVLQVIDREKVALPANRQHGEVVGENAIVPTRTL